MVAAVCAAAAGGVNTATLRELAHDLVRGACARARHAAPAALRRAATVRDYAPRRQRLRPPGTQRGRVITQKSTPKSNKYYSCLYRDVDIRYSVCRGGVSAESTHS